MTESDDGREIITHTVSAAVGPVTNDSRMRRLLGAGKVSVFIPHYSLENSILTGDAAVRRLIFNHGKFDDRNLLL